MKDIFVVVAVFALVFFYPIVCFVTEGWKMWKDRRKWKKLHKDHPEYKLIEGTQLAVLRQMQDYDETYLEPLIQEFDNLEAGCKYLPETALTRTRKQQEELKFKIEGAARVSNTYQSRIDHLEEILKKIRDKYDIGY